MTPRNQDGSLNILLGGAAGQGIQTIEQGLTRLLKQAGYHVFACKEYMSRIRGGSNSTRIRLASIPVAAPLERIDLFIPLDREAFVRLSPQLSEQTLVLGDRNQLPEHPGLVHLPLDGIAEEAGNTRYAGSVAIGAVLGLLGTCLEQLDDYLRQQFADRKPAVIAGNRVAASAGYRFGRQLQEQELLPAAPQRLASVAGDLLLSGTEAIALGALAEGCNFIASYPMSPGTGVLTFLAQQAEEFALVVDQAEDEIAAVNMALGAWYAGARALVSTSGGGFALMSEGLSLAGVTESPLVIHLAQRPGPATGLPTRTAQEDLELALYSGHGEFPRLVLAPGSLQEAFSLTRRAFDRADACQVPAILLTDQYLVDSLGNLPALDMHDLQPRHHIVETDKDYLRYRITENGLSPRGLPGHGTGLVCLDSHEHDEQGHISEDLALRVVMSDKRQRKGELLLRQAVVPQWLGSGECRVLAICWGSTLHALREALQQLRDLPVAGLHFSQVFPLPPETEQLLQRVPCRVVIEGNRTGQFARLLEQSCGLPIHQQILKYDGLPFSVEELARRLREVIEAASNPTGE